MKPSAEMLEMLCRIAPYVAIFTGSLVLSLVITPFVRSLNRRLGMVDNPGGRRINKSPVPRGGGVAVIVSFVASIAAFALFSKGPVSPAFPDSVLWKMIALSVAMGALGFVDDKFGMKPVVKLLGQMAIAALVYFWCGIGFHSTIHAIAWWIDFPLTVFWITGAVNAFNLIDGLDGLASGLAVVAATGMAGTLFFAESPGQMFVHLAFIGSLLGFLRYNFNPASVFLGDTGSMFLGFTLSVMPLVTQAGESFLVGIGVPLLAMGVPIFDTSLAIIRRTVRAVIKREEHSGRDGTRLMQPDSDHLHHRLLRRFVSQKKTAMVLYAFSTFLVLVGIGGVAFKDRAAGLFIIAFVVATFIVVRDMSRVELWDAGKLANMVAHNVTPVRRRRWAAFSVPLLVLADLVILSVTWYLSLVVLRIKPVPQSFHTYLPLRVVPVFLMLVCFGAYSTVWGRALLSNYIRLILATGGGMLLSVAVLRLLGYGVVSCIAFPVIHFGLSLILLLAVRSVRQIFRDLFYLVHARRMADERPVSRVLVFGAGLRYRAFRRELVRRILDGKRIIVGIVDDDILLRGKFIGGVKIDGPHMDAKRIVAETKADSVVIACELSPERLKTVVETFKACGVKVSVFAFSETAF
jgi:UDP-N-acetylmuramyl pentapeptide phosphotransferase/UDP-N-acetylglucosamine-1-phosphate transferase